MWAEAGRCELRPAAVSLDRPMCAEEGRRGLGSADVGWGIDVSRRARESETGAGLTDVGRGRAVVGQGADVGRVYDRQELMALFGPDTGGMVG